MERLTIRNSDVSVSQLMDLKWADALEKLAAYEDCGLTPEELDDFARQACEIRMAAGCKTLDDCWKMVAEGRLMILPCKVEDTVFYNDIHGNVYEAIVQSIVIDKSRTIFITSGIGFDEIMVGKTVFLTRAEAEAVLMGGADR